jgi:hypothetical protein
MLVTLPRDACAARVVGGGVRIGSAGVTSSTRQATPGWMRFVERLHALEPRSNPSGAAHAILSPRLFSAALRILTVKTGRHRDIDTYVQCDQRSASRLRWLNWEIGYDATPAIPQRDEAPYIDNRVLVTPDPTFEVANTIACDLTDSVLNRSGKCQVDNSHLYQSMCFAGQAESPAESRGFLAGHAHQIYSLSVLFVTIYRISQKRL